MAKAVLTIPVNVDEKSVPNSVLQASSNARFLVFGQTLLGALTTFVGAPAWAMRSLAAALSGAVVTRSLFVVKSGTRFRVTVGDAEGVNLSEEADLPYKSFGSFGEFVKRCLDGEILMGSTPAVTAVTGNPGTITLTLPFSAGMLNVEGDLILSTNGNVLATVGAGNSISSLESILTGIGTVTTTDPGSGTGDVEFSIALTGDTPSLALTGAMTETINRVGFVQAVAGSTAEPANAILLDQVSGEVKFVRIASLPSGTDVATVERDVAESTSVFE